jgi:hypothetical protein
VQRERRAVVAVLASAVALGVLTLAHYAANRPGSFGIDYEVYHVAARTARDGADFYAVSPAGSDFRYLYPPVTVLAFLPSTLADGWLPGFLVLTAASVAASAVAARELCRYVAGLGYDVARLDAALVFAFLVVSSHSAPSLAYGQVNHLLVAAFVVGLVRLAEDRDRDPDRDQDSDRSRDRQSRAGALLALPAFVKIFPGAVGLYLLRRRAWRAIAAAVGTAAALTVAGLLAFGVDTYRTYVVDAVLARREVDAFAGGLSPFEAMVTLRRPLSVAFPAVDPTWYAVGAAALLAPVLALVYWQPASRTDWHVALHATLVTMVLWFPSLLVYYAYLTPSLVVCCYDLPTGRGRSLFVAGALVANLSVSYRGVSEALRTLPVSGGSADVVRELLRPVMTVGTPVLYGCLLMLAGCVVYRVEAGAFGKSIPRRAE